MNKKPGNQTFRLGDTVRIVSGPFVSFTGKIEGINQSKSLLQVKVAITRIPSSASHSPWMVMRLNSIASCFNEISSIANA